MPIAPPRDPRPNPAAPWRPARVTFLWLILLALAGPRPQAAAAGEPDGAPGRSAEMVLLSTASNRGETDPCGCSRNPRGGIARRACFVDSLRAAGPLLLVDGGDAIHPNNRKDDRFNRFILEAMERMHYDAMTLGELELYRGSDYVARVLAESALPVTVANAYFTTDGGQRGERLGAEFVLRKIGELGVAVFGLIGQDFGEGPEKFEELGFRIDDPVAVAAALVPRLSGQVDVIVVLAHMGTAEALRLPEHVPGIDVLVPGHVPGTVRPTRVGGAVTVRSGQRGQTLAVTRLDLDPEARIRAYNGRAVTLGVKAICERRDLAEELAALKAAVAAESRREELERQLVEAEELILGQDHYLGADTCARCHQGVYAQWQQTAHAAAWQSLVAEHAEQDAECVECHVTGYRLPGGFRGIGAAEDMRNVQCEACHGMGTAHDMSGEVGTVGEQACLPCHDALNSPGFDFDSYWAQIHH